jgi:hypothetical protein
MPTGYTAGIIDGKIKTFPEFAKLCMRAFGATIHMRDDKMDAEYIPREPSKYHAEQLEKYNKELADANNLSDEVIVSARKDKLETEKEYYLKKVEEVKASLQSLNKILIDAAAYIPPTPDHVGVKKFMIEQIEETIRFDGSTKYYDDRLEEINTELSNLDPSKIRQLIIEDAKKNISYHEKEQAEELKRCETSNKWVQGFLKSISQ